MQAGKADFTHEFRRPEDPVRDIQTARAAGDGRRSTPLGNRLATQAAVANAPSEKRPEAA